MKELFVKPCKYIRLADSDKMIFDIGEDHYCDQTGAPVPPDPKYRYVPKVCNYSDDPWDSDWIENEGLDEKLISKSTTDPVEEIDDTFGCYGFINRAGEYVIEAQYAFAHEFTCGLAAVNLNRTWFKLENGRRVYENHFGYINARGETVIPFSYDEAWPFNKYGVAIVEDRKGSYLIDKTGKRIPGTEGFHFDHFYDYDNRFMEFNWQKDIESYSWENQDEIPAGVYDTKERKVLLPPSIESIIEWEEDFIEVYEFGGEFGVCDFRQWYMNSKGEVLFPWLKDKGYSIVEKPNQRLITIVAVSKFYELSGNPRSYVPRNGKKYERKYFYGLINARGEAIFPLEYDEISELAVNLFACWKNGTATVIQLEDRDF